MASFSLVETWDFSFGSEKTLTSPVFTVKDCPHSQWLLVAEQPDAEGMLLRLKNLSDFTQASKVCFILRDNRFEYPDSFTFAASSKGKKSTKKLQVLLPNLGDGPLSLQLRLTEIVPDATALATLGPAAAPEAKVASGVTPASSSTPAKSAAVQPAPSPSSAPSPPPEKSEVSKLMDMIDFDDEEMDAEIAAATHNTDFVGDDGANEEEEDTLPPMAGPPGGKLKFGVKARRNTNDILNFVDDL